MKLKTEIKKLPVTSEDKNMYYVEISDGAVTIKGVYELSNLRSHIGVIDNEL